MARNNSNCTCAFVTLMIISIVLVSLTAQYGAKYDDSLKYKEKKCKIDRIEYPTIESIINDTSQFTKCSCGKRCTSTLGICNKIYINDVDSNSSTNILLRNDYSLFETRCTFRETRCPDGENIENRKYKISNNIEEMKMYEDYKNNDIILKCYYYNNRNNCYRNIYKNMIILLIFGKSYGKTFGNGNGIALEYIIFKIHGKCKDI